MVTDDVPNEMAETMAGVARALARGGTVQETLQGIADLAAQTIPDVDCAGVSLVKPSGISTPAATDPLVLELDALEERYSEGPCIDAVRNQVTTYCEDLASDERWPRFGPEAAARGMRSLLGYRLYVDGDSLAALNLYSRRPRAFTQSDRDVAVIFAAHAAVALASAEAHERDVIQEVQLREALRSRDVIGQATGILMEREHIDADEALAILRRASQRLNVKLKELATGMATAAVPPHLPPTGASTTSK